MSLVNCICNAAKGAAASVALITLLPIAGPIGTITAGGAAIAATTGCLAGVIDSIRESK